MGKTSLIKAVTSRLGEEAGGFYTEEIRERGIRLGFDLVTLEGERALLAHVEIAGRNRVGKYGVHLANLERFGVGALRKAIKDKKLIVVDEIGKMELLSPAFMGGLRDALESGKAVLGTIMQAAHPQADEVRRHPRVRLILVTESNRAQVLQELLRELGAV